MSNSNQPQMQTPQPNPALKKLEPLVGKWKLTGHLTGSTEKNITGHATFAWLDGGFFLQQDIELNFMGMSITSRELIGHDAKTGKFSSLVYSNMSPVPLPYSWDVDGDKLTINVKYPPLDATFTGSLSEFHGSWKPNPGADPAANIAYEIVSERIK